MSKDYSEDQLIEQTCMEVFQELGWELANVYEGESFGESGTLGRDSEADVILKSQFYQALKNLNPNLPDQAYDLAYDLITISDSTKDLTEINYEKYQYLKDGIPVTYKNQKGEIIRNKKLKVFDFTNPENNNFIAVQQLWLEGKSKRRKRPDIVGFVNGIPLVFIELKGINVKLRAAYEKNLSDYKNTIPKMFHCNAFVILSNGVESKIGSISSKFEHFHEWKRISEEDEGIVSLDTMLKGTCEKNRLLDLFENFILYDTSVGSIAKLVARNHQFVGVNRAISHFKAMQENAKKGLLDKEEAQKLGVFWHTQGSGKSYSMVFLCQKILRVLGGGYSFLLVTDRTELDEQIYGTFAGVGAVKDDSGRATSGEHLKELLKTDKRFLFSIIHKFNFDEKITDRENLIVISDEAHRTQGGTLAMNLRKALPKASFIGFTGTPLFKDDELTKRIFGEYVSKYDFKRSIEDGATVPLYYENRGEKLKLDNPTINQEIREAIEQQDLDSDQEDKLKKLFAREYPILTSQKRLRAIAKDVVKHFNTRGYKGKAMFVALDKVTAVKMYDFITDEWELYLEEELKEINKLTDEQERMDRMRAWNWSKETELGVVVSHEQNEIEKFEAWGLDIEPHRLKMNTRDLETDFKDEDHPFRFAIVCAMWITGFDVKSLSTMYLDKPLKSHTLMQTIARANRVHKNKNNGLIVDYIETYKALLEALAIYGDTGSRGDIEEVSEDAPVKPLEELIQELEEAIKTTEGFLSFECKFELTKILDEQDNLKKIKYLQEGYNAICKTDETKAKFGVLAREVFKKYKALMPDASIYDYKPQRDAINALYSMINAKIEAADITHIVKQVQDVVNQSIATLNLQLEKLEGYGQRIDISSLDFKKIEEEFFKATGNQNVAVQSLKDKVQKKLNRLLNQNPMRIDYYERYQEIIDDYNRGKEYRSIKEIFDELVVLLSELSEEEKRSERESLEEDELAVFDMLLAGKKITDKEKAEVKEAARELLKRLKNQEFQVSHWAEKTQTSSAVKKVIEDILYMKLPYPTYDEDLSLKTELLFNDFKERYADYRHRVA
ncbi:type I restriction endonuclease subunit R [Mangrovimonas futianensis]|uniref:type I restriction endonuclease subunit R n=1 Tax=Mangrovimonas futianensis TaxID=2895523 RepID=UPI001E4727E1|nr:type I restriction endonuclease subunit R [Mangrovimonas futianensis]MCF1420438.1 type I restriction endonuclease subunit R [Mangrovimonas futianensis]